jgi:hypothetical protein
MKGRIVGSLFALPFFGVGVWMLWSISNTIYSAWEMQHWAEVEARLITAGYETTRVAATISATTTPTWAMR